MSFNNPPVTGNAASILIAEDNPAVREFIIRSLSGLGYRLVEAADGEQALASLHREKFNVLVTDIVMPHIDGIELALRANRLFPNLRIVMISGYAQERMRASNLDALVYKIITKPFSLEEIREAVKNALSFPTNAL